MPATLLKFPSPPVRTPLLETQPVKSSLRYEDRQQEQPPSQPIISRAWIQHMQQISDKLTAPVNSVQAGFQSNNPGVFGQIASDGTNLYLCVQANTKTQPAIWKKLALTAF